MLRDSVAAGMQEEIFQQGIFLGAEFDALAVAPDLPRQAIDLEVRGPQDIFLQRRSAAQQGLHPDGQFGHRHRLDDIIVGAGLEILHLAFQVAARGQDQRRHGVAHLAQALEQAGAGAVGQLQIEDDQVVVIGLYDNRARPTAVLTPSTI